MESSVNEYGLPIQPGTKRPSQEEPETSDSSSNGQLSPDGCGDPVLDGHVESRSPKRQKTKAANDVLPRSVCHEVLPSTISLPITLSEEASQESTNQGKSHDSDNIQNCPSFFRYSSANPEPGTGAEHLETPFSGVIKRTTIGHDKYYSLEFKSNALRLFPSRSHSSSRGVLATAKCSIAENRCSATWHGFATQLWRKRAFASWKEGRPSRRLAEAASAAANRKDLST